MRALIFSKETGELFEEIKKVRSIEYDNNHWTVSSNRDGKYKGGKSVWSKDYFVLKTEVF